MLSQDNFERNMTDTFMLKTKDVGPELTRVVVRAEMGSTLVHDI
jgi:hypothetical protein